MNPLSRLAEPPAGKLAGRSRITAVDSLRGIAASMVMLYHVDGAVDVGAGVPRTASLAHAALIATWGDGRAWILLFFILSGFALSISVEHRFDYLGFAIRRVTRLMIPCAAAILLSAALELAIHPEPLPGLSAWFNQDTWSMPVSWKMVLGHLLMTGHWEDTRLDPVLWTLVIELRISLIFPVLYFSVKRWPWLSALGAAVLGLGSTFLAIKEGDFRPYFNRNWVEAVITMGYYTPPFVAGILARKYMGAACAYLGKLNGRVVMGSGVAALAVALFLMHAGGDLRMGAGALLLLLVAVTVPEISRVLSVAPLAWLGKISYSVYLVHMLVLATIFYVFYGRANLYLLSAAAVVATPLVAWAFYGAVVGPSIRLGRQLTRARTPRATPDETAAVAG